MANNPYCERLSIPVPDLDDVYAANKKEPLFYFLVLALVERGEPMSVDEIAERLRQAGVRETATGLEKSLVKSWHGSDPVYRLPDGRFGLDLKSDYLDLILFMVGARPAKHPLPPEPESPADSVPLSEEEVMTAFRGRDLYGLSALRQAAAILEALGRCMTVDDLESLLSQLTKQRSHLTLHRVRKWNTDLVRCTPEEILELNHHSAELLEVRRDIRKRYVAAKKWQAQQEQFARSEEERAEEHTREVREIAALKRALIHAVPATGMPRAVSILDLQDRSIQTFIDDDLPKVADELSSFGVLVGFRVRETLFRLGFDAVRWRIVDLASSPKSIRLNQRGRTLKLTPELLIRSTTGISRPLGEPRRIKKYLEQGERTRLVRRIESDVKSLAAYYHYGILHDWIRLRWGFLDELLRVYWRLPGEPSILEILSQAVELGAPVDVVLGNAPGWTDPWSRGMRGMVAGYSEHEVHLAWGNEVRIIDRFDIQAIRVVDDWSRKC